MERGQLLGAQTTRLKPWLPKPFKVVSAGTVPLKPKDGLNGPPVFAFLAKGCKRSEEVGHQGGSLLGIGSVRLPKLAAHPLLLHAEFEPEHQED